MDSTPAEPGLLGDSSTARVERALFHRARSTSSGGQLSSSSLILLSSSGKGGWLWCSCLRALGKSLNYHSSRGAAGLFFTARIEGPPFHRGASASKKNGPAAPLHIFPRPRVARARRATGYPLHSLPHILPLLRHLRFARRIALGRLRHHHGVEAPL
jgi:hypothetical protein